MARAETFVFSVYHADQREEPASPVSHGKLPLEQRRGSDSKQTVDKLK